MNNISNFLIRSYEFYNQLNGVWKQLCGALIVLFVGCLIIYLTGVLLEVDEISQNAKPILIIMEIILPCYVIISLYLILPYIVNNIKSLESWVIIGDLMFFLGFCWMFANFRYYQNPIIIFITGLGLGICISTVLYIIIDLIIRNVMNESNYALSIKDFLLSLLIPTVGTIVSCLFNNFNNKLDEKLNFMIQENFPIKKCIYDFVKLQNHKAINPSRKEINKFFGEDVTNYINDMVRAYHDKDTNNNETKEKGKVNFYLEKRRFGYRAK